MKAGAADSQAIEVFGDSDRPVAYVVGGELLPTATQFVTPPGLPQQVGFVAYPRAERSPGIAIGPLSDIFRARRKCWWFARGDARWTSSTTTGRPWRRASCVAATS